jgi:hypothetical protein
MLSYCQDWPQPSRSSHAITTAKGTTSPKTQPPMAVTAAASLRAEPPRPRPSADGSLSMSRPSRLTRSTSLLRAIDLSARTCSAAVVRRSAAQRQEEQSGRAVAPACSGERRGAASAPIVLGHDPKFLVDESRGHHRIAQLLADRREPIPQRRDDASNDDAQQAEPRLAHDATLRCLARPGHHSTQSGWPSVAHCCYGLGAAVTGPRFRA